MKTKVSHLRKKLLRKNVKKMSKNILKFIRKKIIEKKLKRN